MTAVCPHFPMPRDDADRYGPPPELVRLRDEAPISRVQLWDGSTAWLVTRYDDQRALLSDPRFSADTRRPGFPQSAPATASWFARARPLMTMDGPEHGALRRAMTASFTIKSVERLRPRVQELVDGLIDDILAAGPVADLVTALAQPVPSAVICELLGVPYADHAYFIDAAHTVVSGRSTADEAAQAIDGLRAYMAELADAKAATPDEGLYSKIVATQYLTGTYTREETAAIGLQLLLAGHDTTASQIALGTLALLDHPDQAQRLRDDPSPAAVAGAVEELLRFLTITHTGRRRVALEDVEIAGHLIRAGEGVIAPSDVSNREAGVFGRPDDLDLARSARHHLTFGYGVHQCLGAPLARLELQVVHATLFRRIPTLRLAVPHSELAYKDDSVVYGLRALPVTW